MKRIALEIELLEDAVFSARAATEGGHQSLDRIPGSALLGAAAARLYGALGEAAFTAFHSGRLRFGDGLPATPAGPAWPVPFCWHHDKLNSPVEEGRLNPDRLVNFIHTDSLGEEKQPKQLRLGYVARDGAYRTPRASVRLKTAIDPGTGRAATGQLFGYQALHRGQTFLATVEADDDVDESLFQRVCEALQGEVLLGRSRSAEYGRARIRETDAAPIEAGPAPGNGEAILWLLSDLALADEWGEPVLRPEGEHLGLPGARVDWCRSFLRTRRYSPWNAARRGYDNERLVLAAGSVLTLTGVDDAARAALAERLEGGLGLHREAGLGRIWLDPPLLRDVHPAFDDSVSKPEAVSEPSDPEHPLVAWLTGHSEGWKAEGEAAAQDFENEYLRLIKDARRLQGVGPGEHFGPSRSQWGKVLQTASDTNDADELYRRLFEGDDAILNEEGEGWSIWVFPHRCRRSLADWLKGRLRPGYGGVPTGRAYLHFLRIAARRIQDHISRRSV